MEKISGSCASGSSASASQSKWLVLTTSLVVMGMVFFFFDQISFQLVTVAEVETKLGSDINGTHQIHHTAVATRAPRIYLPAAPRNDPMAPKQYTLEECDQACQKNGTDYLDLQHHDGLDLTNSTHLLHRFNDARSKYIQKLKEWYGEEYYHDIFEPFRDGQRVSAGKVYFTEPPNLQRFKYHYWEDPPAAGTAWSRMTRKFQMKMLQIQLGILKERIHGGIDPCLEQCERGHAPKTYTQFVWATGGHSSSAGHGNLYYEAYTATMERAVKPIMEAIGVDFEARGYASGGTLSGYEGSICHQSIYGKDIDAISWDFGQTDGRDYEYLMMYAYRAATVAKIKDTKSASQPGNIPHRPAFFLLNQQEWHNTVLHGMYLRGMTAIGYAPQEEGNLVASFPDMVGMTDEQIDALPSHVKHFRCGWSLENGHTCGGAKWTMVCGGLGERGSWHPGWKYHAIRGNLLAVMLLDSTADGIKKLVETEPLGQESLTEKHDRIAAELEKLNLEEDADYQRIFDEPPAHYIQTWMNQQWYGSDKKLEAKRRQQHAVPPLEAARGLDMQRFLKDPMFCHTGIRPAEIRLKGLLTESNFTRNQWDDYYEADDRQLWRAGNLSFVGRMRRNLKKGGSRDPNCPHKGAIDGCDYWSSVRGEGWRTIALPNDSEQAYYTEFDAKNSNGWVFVCLKKCSWGKCAHDEHHHHNMFGSQAQDHADTFGRVDMIVNDVPVTDGHFFDQKCMVLRHAGETVEEQVKWTPNDEGKYVFKIRIEGGMQHSFMAISSFVFG